MRVWWIACWMMMTFEIVRFVEFEKVVMEL